MNPTEKNPPMISARPRLPPAEFIAAAILRAVKELETARFVTNDRKVEEYLTAAIASARGACAITRHETP